jgi:glycosyltransferase involved in cell wall biosynthesis
MVAPVTLFVYNRLAHTRKTVEALRANDLATLTDLVVFSDGPKDSTDAAAVEEVRKYISAINGFRSVSITASEINKGLADSVISGVSAVLEEYERIIVLEDDMVTSKHFLSYMNDSLERYESNQDVISVHAYMYPVKGSLPEYFFLKGAHCWGWGTWRRGWNLYERDGRNLLNRIRERNGAREFDYDDAYPFTSMLENQILGLNQSWAIRWHATAFVNDKLTLYPSKSFVQNIGFDDSGVHSIKRDQVYQVNLRDSYSGLPEIPVAENANVRRMVSRFFKSIKPGFIERVVNKLKSMMR